VLRCKEDEDEGRGIEVMVAILESLKQLGIFWFFFILVSFELLVLLLC
jgi:hypothetical protein